MRLRHLFGNVLLALASTLLCLTAAEIALRIIYPTPKGNEVSSMEYRHSWIFNADGFRDDDFGVKLSKHRPNVIFLGDSFVAGMGVERDRRFTTYLADALARDAGLEAFNLGRIGTGTIAQNQILEKYLPKIRPRAVVLFFYWNDLEDNLEEAAASGKMAAAEKTRSDSFFAFLKPVKPALQKTMLYQWLSANYRIWMARFGVSKLDFRIEFDLFEKDLMSPPARKAWANTDSALKEMRDYCALNHALLAVVYVPKREQFVHWDNLVRFYKADPARYDRFAPDEQLQRTCDRLHLPLIDVSGDLDRLPDKEGLFYKFDTHFTDAGNRRYFEALYPRLKAWLEALA